MNNMANILNEAKWKGSEVVVVAFFDPEDRSQTAASSLELTRKQAESVVSHLKACGVHKMSVTSRRKVTPLGMGTAASPVVETEKLPPSHVEVLLFTPR
jgi:hypothetical protein